MRTSPLFSTILASCLCLVSAETYRTKVAILGGGVSGISAALNLTSQGITDFMMIEARDVLGGNTMLFMPFFFFL
jgi:polyamine oxidase